jgi:hypothetical protein
MNPVWRCELDPDNRLRGELPACHANAAHLQCGYGKPTVIEDEWSIVVRSDVNIDDRYVWGGTFFGDNALKNAEECAARESEDWPSFAPFRLYRRHRVVTEVLIDPNEPTEDAR